MIIYSIIIFHKNCPDLLQRCLDFIPCREDLQIIVVDDNSNTKVTKGYKADVERFFYRRYV